MLNTRRFKKAHAACACVDRVLRRGAIVFFFWFEDFGAVLWAWLMLLAVNFQQNQRRFSQKKQNRLLVGLKKQSLVGCLYPGIGQT